MDRIPNPSQYETERVIGFVLKRKPDGSCHYLHEGGCSIWPNTAGVCGAFDCRVYASPTGRSAIRLPILR
jgi:hypothetical protein